MSRDAPGPDNGAGEGAGEQRTEHENQDIGALSAEVRYLQRQLARAEARARNLQRALVTNRRIGMAVGILMTRQRMTEEQAFAVLRRVSNEENTKLRDVAERVIYTGTV